MSTLQAIRIEGGIVPPALFQHIQSGDIGDPASRAAASYHLPGRETIRDAANRSWTYLTGAWEAWREAQDREPGGTASTNAALVRERWLLVLLQELGYGRLPARTGGIDVDEHHYPVSHVWQHVPIHLLGPGVDLDRRNPGVAGATRAPQAMVQELLNRTDNHLWAVLSNGLRLRLLRDSTALAGSAFIEFDLEAIFDGELFAEFLLLWQACHQSRLEARETDSGEPSITECWLELWRADSVRAGARALDRLRSGVEDALSHLGTGFLAHPANTDLRAALHSGALRPEDYHRHLLRLVYRLLFLFVTEDRDVLLDPSADATARARYTDFLSTQRLRAQARQRQGSASYADLWQAQRLVLRAVGGDGRPELALPALGGLFDPEKGGAEPLLDAELANDAFLAAIRDLAWLRAGQRFQPVDYRNLGAEELGSVYEALLELVPRVSVDDHRFTLEHLSGNERKTTGSYYTPPGLVSALLDTALDPVLDDAVAGAGTSQEAEDRLLALKVVDPACGSGHFIVAAARRIAQRVAAARSGEDEPTPAEVRHALRDVVGRCVYGVDLNPLAAELAKVSLWLEAVEPGKALGFLDARIRVGNSLLGTTPALLAAGVPDEAFKPLEGDDKRIASAVRKRNAAERGKHGHGQDLLDLDFTPPAVHALAEARQALLQPHDDARAVRAQARRWRDYEGSADYRDRKAHADAWTAAFVWPLLPSIRPADTTPVAHAETPTSAIVRRLGSEPNATALAPVRAEVERLAAEYRFFHWHLEFPEVFEYSGDGSQAADVSLGFDAVIGNPPWEHIELKEKEFFASRDPEIAAATGARRKRLISDLALTDRSLHALYLASKRQRDAIRKFASESGVFPLTGRGRAKTDSLMAELFCRIVGPNGRVGIIIPTGIATGATSQHFFRDVSESHRLVSFYAFSHASEYFGKVAMQFALMTILGRTREGMVIDLAADLFDVRDLADRARRYALTHEEIRLVNPDTRTLPLFGSRADAELCIRAYRSAPPLGSERVSDFSVSFRQGLFNVTSDSGQFRTHQQLEEAGARLEGDVYVTVDGTEFLPLIEAKMYAHFDHRWRTYEGGRWIRVPEQTKADPMGVAMPQVWVDRENVTRRIGDRVGADQDWLLCWRETGRADDERTWIPAVVPLAGVGNQSCVMFTSSQDAAIVVACGSSFAADYVARQKVPAANLNQFIVLQFPVFRAGGLDDHPISAAVGGMERWIINRVVELVHTDVRMNGFARSLDRPGAPFVFCPERRELMRAELDAAFFHLYGMGSDDVAYVMDTFPSVRGKDRASFGEYRTKRLILEAFTAMQRAVEVGGGYQTVVDPPPGHGPRHQVMVETGSVSRRAL